MKPTACLLLVLIYSSLYSQDEGKNVLIYSIENVFEQYSNTDAGNKRSQSFISTRKADQFLVPTIESILKEYDYFKIVSLNQIKDYGDNITSLQEAVTEMKDVNFLDEKIDQLDVSLLALDIFFPFSYTLLKDSLLNEKEVLNNVSDISFKKDAESIKRIQQEILESKFYLKITINRLYNLLDYQFYLYKVNPDLANPSNLTLDLDNYISYSVFIDPNKNDYHEKFEDAFKHIFSDAYQKPINTIKLDDKILLHDENRKTTTFKLINTVDQSWLNLLDTITTTWEIEGVNIKLDSNKYVKTFHVNDSCVLDLTSSVLNKKKDNFKLKFKVSSFDGENESDVTNFTLSYAIKKYEVNAKSIKWTLLSKREYTNLGSRNMPKGKYELVKVKFPFKQPWKTRKLKDIESTFSSDLISNHKISLGNILKEKHNIPTIRARGSHELAEKEDILIKVNHKRKTPYSLVLGMNGGTLARYSHIDSSGVGFIGFHTGLNVEVANYLSFDFLYYGNYTNVLENDFYELENEYSLKKEFSPGFQINMRSTIASWKSESKREKIRQKLENKKRIRSNKYRKNENRYSYREFIRWEVNTSFIYHQFYLQNEPTYLWSYGGGISLVFAINENYNWNAYMNFNFLWNKYYWGWLQPLVGIRYRI